MRRMYFDIINEEHMTQNTWIISKCPPMQACTPSQGQTEWEQTPVRNTLQSQIILFRQFYQIWRQQAEIILWCSDDVPLTRSAHWTGSVSKPKEFFLVLTLSFLKQ